MAHLRTIAAGFALLACTAAPASAFDWDGPYVGIFGGYSVGQSDAAYSDPLLSPFNLDSAPSGWLLGANVGANFDAGNGIVLGVEADGAISDITDTIDDELGNFLGHPGGPHTITSTTTASASLRGRVGVSSGDFLPYLTAGLAVANVEVSATDGPLEESGLLTGWTAGAGVEVGTSENISFKLEYLYTQFGDHTWFEGEAFESVSSSTSHTVRAGVNFAMN